MSYRIVDKDKKQLKGTISFDCNGFDVKFGHETKGKVIVSKKDSLKSPVILNDMREFALFISNYEKEQVELDNEY